MAVSHKLAFEIYTIELWHILSLALFVIVNYFIYKKARKTPLLFSYLSTQLMLIIWIVSKIFKTVSPTIQIRWLFIVTQYFGVSFLSSTLLIFAFIYAKKKIPSIKQMILFHILPLYSFIVVLTNPLHFQFYSRFTFYADKFGTLFYINMAISYLYLIAAIVLLSKGFLKMFGKERKRAYLFSVGIFIPFVINIFYVLGLFKVFFNHRPLFDYTPIATSISLILFALAAFKYRFLDILPIASEMVLNNISNAIVITDKSKKVLYFNASFHSIFPLIQYSDELPTELNQLSDDSFRYAGKKFKVILKQKKRYSIYRLIDITNMDNMMLILKEKNSELSKANKRLEGLLSKKRTLAALKTRNYIFQELHDVLGHTSILAISACEMDALSGAKEYNHTLSTVKKLVYECKTELTRIFNDTKTDLNGTSLQIALKALIAATSNSQLSVELTIQGNDYELSKTKSTAIYRLCQEATTNAIKHSNATTLSIILRYNENDIEVFVIDNGTGCKDIKKGKGLLGMENRICSLKGDITFTSDINCGFFIYSKLPKEEK